MIDHYGPNVPIGGGALTGKDSHKVDKCGALRARQLAKKLVRGGVDEARVMLGWCGLKKGSVFPHRKATTAQGGVSLQVPRDELPSDGMVQDRGDPRPGTWNCQQRDWAADMLAGYFCQSPWPVGSGKSRHDASRHYRVPLDAIRSDRSVNMETGEAS